MAALFPVVDSTAMVYVGITTDADERESAWSLMARATQTAQQKDDTYALTFNETTKQLRIEAGSVFSMTCDAEASGLTGFATVNTGAFYYVGAALSSVVVVEGLRMSPPGWSTTGGKVSSTGGYVNPPRWQTGSVSLAMAVNYADAFNVLKTIRSGVWDVVSDGVWLGRIRVTGASLEPQGRLPGIVEARINGVATP